MQTPSSARPDAAAAAASGLSIHASIDEAPATTAANDADMQAAPTAAVSEPNAAPSPASVPQEANGSRRKSHIIRPRQCLSAEVDEPVGQPAVEAAVLTRAAVQEAERQTGRVLRSGHVVPDRRAAPAAKPGVPVATRSAKPASTAARAAARSQRSAALPESATAAVQGHDTAEHQAVCAPAQPAGIQCTPGRPKRPAAVPPQSEPDTAAATIGTSGAKRRSSRGRKVATVADEPEAIVA